jgi:hypothetical protein
MTRAQDQIAIAKCTYDSSYRELVASVQGFRLM